MHHGDMQEGRPTKRLSSRGRPCRSAPRHCADPARVEALMPVLCEAISLIVRAESIKRTFGNFENFKAIVPNNTLAADDEIVRIGFMAQDDVYIFVEQLEKKGLRYIVNCKARDMVVVDQLRGPSVSCDWIEFGHVTMDGGRVVAARLSGSNSRQLVTPDWWTFEKSFSRSHIVVPTDQKDKSLRYLREENGVEVYLNLLDGQEVYIGRTGWSADQSGAMPPRHQSREEEDGKLSRLRKRLLSLAGWWKR
jgi:hypothetical protein